MTAFHFEEGDILTVRMKGKSGTLLIKGIAQEPTKGGDVVKVLFRIEKQDVIKEVNPQDILLVEQVPLDDVDLPEQNFHR